MIKRCACSVYMCEMSRSSVDTDDNQNDLHCASMCPEDSCQTHKTMERTQARL